MTRARHHVTSQMSDCGAAHLLSGLVFPNVQPNFEILKQPEVTNWKTWTILWMQKQLYIQVLHCVQHNTDAMAWHAIMLKQNSQPLKLWPLSYNS